MEVPIFSSGRFFESHRGRISKSNSLLLKIAPENFSLKQWGYHDFSQKIVSQSRKFGLAQESH